METTPPTQPPAAPPGSPAAPGGTPGSFQTPSDYYSTPTGEAKKGGCPRWLIFGCGGLGCLALIIIFVGGGLAMRSGGGAFMGWMFEQLDDQSGKIMASEVSEVQKSAFNAEMSRIQGNIKQKKLRIQDLQAILNAFRSASGDNSLSPEEVEELTQKLKDANDRAERVPPGTRSVRGAGGKTFAPGVFSAVA